MPDFGLGFFIPHQRSIGNILADVTAEETERDEVTVTEHPVEQGAPVADHAFKRPEEVMVRVGWSVQKSGDLSAESGVYGILLNWQASFVPFDLYTGKRRHRNMMITSLWVTTDEHSEYALLVNMQLRELILTQTETTATGIGAAQNQADSSVTGQQTEMGNQTTSNVTDLRPGGALTTPPSVPSDFKIDGLSIDRPGLGALTPNSTLVGAGV